MKRLIPTLMLVLSCTAAWAQSNVVQTAERTFRIKYKDGVVEQFKVRWAGIIENTTREDGHPAIPEKLWFTDTRQCHWTATGRVERHVMLISRGGKEFEDTNKFQVHRSDVQNKGSDFVLTNLRSENCNDARSRRESDFNNVQTMLIAKFGGITAADFMNVIAEFKKNGEVVMGQ